MGYYDNNQKTVKREQNRQPKRGGWFFSGLIGAIVGIIFMMVVSPILNNYGLLPYGAQTVQTEEMSSGTHSSQQSQQTVQNKTTMNVDVNTQTTKVVDKVADTVVGVINYQKVGGRLGLLRSSQGKKQQLKRHGLGSGVIYKKEDGYAYVVTNNHVVAGANEVKVSLDRNTKVNAKIVGTDKLMDLAVLRIDGEKVHDVAEFGNSDNVEVGEPVLAIGNPLGLYRTVTKGIISAENRTVPRDLDGDHRPDWRAQVLQTDASINPGNSGGALVNMKGQVIGINSMKISETAVEGIGFAIPINIVKPIIHELEKQGYVDRSYMGIYMQPLNVYPQAYIQKVFDIPKDVKHGIIVRSVVAGSPADKAGLRPLDIIVSLDGHSFDSMIEFRKILFKKTDPGDKVALTLYRKGEKKTIHITLGHTKQ